MAAKRGRCPRCIVGGAKHKGTIGVVSPRPLFGCDRCGHEWTCGKDGGEWAYLVVESEGRRRK